MSAATVSHTLSFGPLAIDFSSDDAEAAHWLRESLAPSFIEKRDAADWRVSVVRSAGAFEELRRERPASNAKRACFALDREVVALPAWSADGGTLVHDEERCCFFRIRGRTVELIADPQSLRWRFTLQWIFHEIVATRLRDSHLDAHAAAVESGGRVLLIVGPKGAGKTTLSFHLLRTPVFRWLANDRAFVGTEGGGLVVRGLPTAVKIRPPLDAQFPSLVDAMPGVERPYLLSLDELARCRGAYAPSAAIELALSPAQVAQRLRADRLGEAPLGAVVFPEVRPDVEGWTAERLTASIAAAAMRANRYGGAHLGQSEPTVFEDGAGRTGPRPPEETIADDLFGATPAYRLALGRDAYREPRLTEGMRELLFGG